MEISLPPIQKRFPPSKPIKPKTRTRTIFLLATIIVVLAVGIGVYVYETSITANAPDFKLNAPSQITTRTNSTSTSKITIDAVNRFGGNVALSVNAPPNVTATITPPNVTGSGNSTLTLSPLSGGTFTITITGTSGSSTHSVIVTIYVQDFSLGAPSGITVRTTATTISTVNVAVANQFNGKVALSVSVPSNITATISPMSVTGSGTATLTTSVSFPGIYNIIITGTSGGLKHSVASVVATPVYATLSVTNGTASGTIEVELYRAQTPKTVANFVSLAQTHFYDNLVWHRIATNPAVIQTGDPNTRYGNTSVTTWGTGGSSQTIPLEIDPSLSNVAGTLGMARGSDKNSATSQFYVNYNDNTSLDGNYAVFGKVINDNMNMVHSISVHPTDSGEHPLAPLPFLVTVTISYTP